MSKLPLLLLPGLLCDKETWTHQFHHLSDIADIIIPDLSSAASPQQMVAAALNKAPPYFAVAGHSMGGWVALEIMKNCSERVMGLCLLNTTAWPDSKEKHHARQAMIANAHEGNNAAIIEKLMQLFIHNKAVAYSVKAMLERNIPNFINQEQAMIQREECIKILDCITCPTLIIHSADDAIFQYEESQFLAEKIKHATLSVIKNCGHMSPMEAPQKITHLMRSWLQNIRSFPT